MPRLKALNRYWVKHPPLHLLVAAYLGYQAPPETRPRATSKPTDDDAPTTQKLPVMMGMASIPASDEFRSASTLMDGLAAAERMFFGNVI